MDTKEDQAVGIRVLCAYMECSDEVQKLIKDLITEVLLSSESDSDEKQMAVFSIADALFPNPYNGDHGIGLLESGTDAAKENAELLEIISCMDAQEASFSERLRTLMEEQGVTQQELADAVGLRQSAIANILGRNCRPQKRTVKKIAEAMGVAPKDLWPSFTL